MKIKFYPQGSENLLSININQGLIEVNGISYDFSPLPEYESVQLPEFVVTRLDGELNFQFALPYPEQPSIDIMQVYEVEIDDTFSGPIDVPGHEHVEYEEITEGVINWPDPIPIEDRRESKWREVEEYRNKLMQIGGFPINGFWLHSDLLSRSQQLGLIELGKKALAAGVLPNQTIPNTPPWRTMTGVYIDLTPELTESLIAAFLLQEASVFAVGDYWRNQINNSDNPESIDLKSEVFLNSWPTTFKKP